MDEKTIVAEIMSVRGHNKSSLAEKLGYAAPSGITERLRGKQAMRIDTLARILEALDCEIVIRSTLPKDRREWKIEFDNKLDC